MGDADIDSILLSASRNGELGRVQELLSTKDDILVDVNCKGKTKSNLGWSPLHLATYFGHKEVVHHLLEVCILGHTTFLKE